MKRFHLEPADIELDARGIPRSRQYGDIYHSASGWLAQARHVFLGGNDLPLAWRKREQFVVLETGFGLGLNFLATWQAWRNDPQRCARLHFVSVEKHPCARDRFADMQRQCLGEAPELLPLGDALQAQWPILTPGMHRLFFDDERVTLTLMFGDAATQMRKLSLQADALYLDGFAPTKNAELWEPHFLKVVTRLCKPGATLATWTVAAPVRDALRPLRWELIKAPGFGTKRDMLRGRLHGYTPTTTPEKHAVVIGAGIAGAAIAERLAVRGWRIELLERLPDIAGGASGNPVGLLHPMLAKDDNLAARLSRAGYFHALRLLAQLDTEVLDLRWQQCGILQLARDAEQEAAQRDTIDALQFPEDYASFVDSAQAARASGHTVSAGGWWYPAGAIVEPPSLCRALLRRHATAIDIRTSTSVERLEHDGKTWRVFDAPGQQIAESSTIIVANAFDAQRLLPQSGLPLHRMRGQITLIEQGTFPFLRHALCGNGYLTPDTLGIHALGATFESDDDDLRPREASHRENLQRLYELLPGQDVTRFDAVQLEGRVGFRTMAVDRMPVVGAVPDVERPLKPGTRFRDVPRKPGLYALLALGSRGMCWGPLAAELLASQIAGEPLPLERDLVDALDPARFAIRTQRRGASSTIVSAAPDL